MEFIDIITSISYFSKEFITFLLNSNMLYYIKSALISKLPIFILSSGFYNLPDNIEQDKRIDDIYPFRYYFREK